MTFERSHNKSRLERPRLRSVSQPSAADREPGSTAGRPYRAANRSLTATARAAAAKALGSVGANRSTPPEAAQIAQEGLRLFRAFVRELGTTSPTARAFALSFAMQSMAAQRLTLAATEAGLGTDRGAQLLEAAARSQGRAERAATAAATFAGLLRGKPGDQNPAPWFERDPNDDSEATS